ncbi:MAG TPA: ATP-binding protein [Rhodocyclaceae bacterium]|nr:ATP-binding protein [Rhodocyclaceae bacterium]
MLSRRIEDITDIDIQRLVSMHAEESQNLDFKQELPGRDTAARHEFCADVCALANAQGGDLVYGVQEDDQGCASVLMPQPDNIDDTVLRLQDMALNGIEPKITGIHARGISIAGGNVFVVRIPKSWHAPHRVRTNQHFYVREGRRKRQLDVPEIKAAFLRSEGAAERLRNFRIERIGRLLAGDAPVPLAVGVIGLLHVLPLQPSATATVDPRIYQLERHLPVISGTTSLDFRLNLDGGVAHRVVTENGCGAYTLLFRDGSIEAARVFTQQLDNGTIVLPSSAYEKEILSFATSITNELNRLELGPPYVVMYSILNAKAGCLGVSAGHNWYAGNECLQFDRDVLAYPDVVITHDVPIDAALRPLFDLVWQSVGRPYSLNYDEKGIWVGRV